MQRASIVRWGVFLNVVLATLLGCAVGTSDDPIDETNLRSIPVEAGNGDEGSVKLPPPSSMPEGGAGDANSDSGAPTADGGADSGPSTDLCAPTTACATTATDLGSVSGDENNDVKTASGVGSQWLKVLVKETDNGVIANDEKARFALTSPAGSNFDLYVYRSADPTHSECSVVAASSTTTSTTDSTDLSWGESGLFPNGSDDSSLVTIEVRHVSGSCSAAARWSLSVTGNP